MRRLFVPMSGLRTGKDVPQIEPMPGLCTGKASSDVVIEPVPGLYTGRSVERGVRLVPELRTGNRGMSPCWGFVPANRSLEFRAYAWASY